MDKIKIDSFQDIYNFTFAGNATITLESGRTGKWFTFKIKKANKKDEKSPYFVSLLSGASNTSDFRYVGLIVDKKEFRLTTKSTVSEDAISYQAFRFFFNQLLSGSIISDLKVYHSGICGRCGRTLTTPESISRGIGPECARINKK